MGSVFSHLWHWALREGEKAASEAEQLIELGFLVHAVYPASKQEFDVSIAENNGVLVWVFNLKKK